MHVASFSLLRAIAHHYCIIISSESAQRTHSVTNILASHGYYISDDKNDKLKWCKTTQNRTRTGRARGRRHAKSWCDFLRRSRDDAILNGHFGSESSLKSKPIYLEASTTTGAAATGLRYCSASLMAIIDIFHRVVCMQTVLRAVPMALLYVDIQWWSNWHCCQNIWGFLLPLIKQNGAGDQLTVSNSHNE